MVVLFMAELVMDTEIYQYPITLPQFPLSPHQLIKKMLQPG